MIGTAIQNLGLYDAAIAPSPARTGVEEVESRMSDIRRRAIVLVLASATLVNGTRLAAIVAPQDKPTPAPATQQTSEQQDASALSQAVDAVAAGRPAPDTFVTWLGNHFIRSQGDSIYVPFTVSI